MDQQLYVLGLFFDLTKVYDVINHEILLNKLEYYGIRGTIKAWIEFYLIHRNLLKYLKLTNRGRNQQIYKSSRKETKHRFHQESVLGILLFLLSI